MVLRPAKFKKYVNLLYEGFKERHKSGETSNGRRIKLTEEHGILVVRACKQQCIVCGEKYNIKNQLDFEIHHVDGNRSNTVTGNLILLCHKHHREITAHAKALYRDIIQEDKAKTKASGSTKKTTSHSKKTTTKTKSKSKVSPIKKRKSTRTVEDDVLSLTRGVEGRVNDMTRGLF